MLEKLDLHVILEAMEEDKVRLDRRFDWVGPPDRVSKIRPIRCVDDA